MSQDSFVEISAGKTLFREGETGTLMYVIESGLVELQRNALVGQPGVLLGPGDFCGAEFLIEGKPHTATAIVKENARVLRLSRADLVGVIGENPEIAIGLLRRLLESQGSAQVLEIKRPLEQAKPDRTRDMAAAAPSAPVAAPSIIAPPPIVAPPPMPASVPTVVPAVSSVVVSPDHISTAPATPTGGHFALRICATGQILPLEGERNDFMVGRPDPSSGMRPEIDLGPFDVNRSLSRRHARIVVHDGVYFVREDSATINGTYANGERLSTGVEVPLKLADRLRFGTIEVEFVAV